MKFNKLHEAVDALIKSDDWTKLQRSIDITNRKLLPKSIERIRSIFNAYKLTAEDISELESRIEKHEKYLAKAPKLKKFFKIAAFASAFLTVITVFINTVLPAFTIVAGLVFLLLYFGHHQKEKAAITIIEDFGYDSYEGYRFKVSEKSRSRDDKKDNSETIHYVYLVTCVAANPANPEHSAKVSALAPETEVSAFGASGAGESTPTNTDVIFNTDLSQYNALRMGSEFSLILFESGHIEIIHPARKKVNENF